MIVCAHPAPIGGAYASSRTSGGRRWTRGSDEGCGPACGKSVWSRSPDAGINPQVKGPGGTVAKKSRTPRRARHKPQNHCAGKAGMCRRTCITRVRFALSTWHTRLRVRRASGFPCALCFRGTRTRHSPGGIAPREGGIAPSVVMPALVTGIHVLASPRTEKTWMAGTSPAMTRQQRKRWKGPGTGGNPPNPHHIWHKSQAGTASAWPGRGNVLIGSLPLPTATQGPSAARLRGCGGGDISPMNPPSSSAKTASAPDSFFSASLAQADP